MNIACLACVRCYANIVKHDLTIIVYKISANSVIPDNLWVILGCDITRVNYEYLKQDATLRGLKEIKLEAGQLLEAKLYDNYPDLLLTYFGMGIHLHEIWLLI